MSAPVDYYALLDLRRDATHLQVLQAYRRLALQLHPEKQPEGASPSIQSQFQLISEAYDVLTHPELRAVFDYYGEKGLKSGVTLHTGQQAPPYALSTAPLALFESVFGQASPYSALLSYNTAAAIQEPTAPLKPSPIVVKLFLSLEELYHGCQKKVKVARKRLTSLPTSTDSTPTPTTPAFVLDERLLALNVVAGYRAGTKITFEGEGDESESGVKGDVQFVVCERPHPRMERVKDDVVWVCELTLADALCGSVVMVEMLDERVLSVALSEVCTPKGEKRVKGEGMPKVGGGKGDLLIRYDIRFPEQLTLAQKEQLRQLLQ